MKLPHFFPNLTIQKNTLELLLNRFPKVALFKVTEDVQGQAENDSVVSGIEPINPISDQQDMMTYLMNGIDSAPIAEPESASRLGADLVRTIQSGVTDTETSKDLSERALKAALYLHMAAEYDRQSFEIAEGLDAIIKRKAAVLNEIDCGEDTLFESPESGYIERANVEYQPEQRLKAWSLLFVDAVLTGKCDEGGIYFTDSIETIDIIREFTPDIEHVEDLSLDSSADPEIEDYLETLAECTWPEDQQAFKINDYVGALGGPVLRLFIVPDTSPFSVFKRFSSGLNRADQPVKQGGKTRNTVIGLVKI